MPFIRAGALTVHYDIAGPPGAPTVVFSNSLGTNLHLWDEQVAALAPRWRMVRYDTRGHGLTALAPPGEGYAIEQLATDLALLFDALDITRAHLVGLSIGGLIAQRFAAEHPERVDALVLAATNNRIGTRERWDARITAVEEGGIAAVADGVLAGWFSPPTHAAHPEVIGGYRAMLERTPLSSYLACAAAVRDADLRSDDARIAAPVLVVLGSADPTCPPAGDDLANAIRGARTAVIEGAGHLVCADKPREFTASIEQFIQSATTAGSVA